MGALENIEYQNTAPSPPTTSTMTTKVAVLDGMAIVQSLGKPKSVKT